MSDTSKTSRNWKGKRGEHRIKANYKGFLFSQKLCCVLNIVNKFDPDWAVFIAIFSLTEQLLLFDGVTANLVTL